MYKWNSIFKIDQKMVETEPHEYQLMVSTEDGNIDYVDAFTMNR